MPIWAWILVSIGGIALGIVIAYAVILYWVARQMAQM